MGLLSWAIIDLAINWGGWAVSAALQVGGEEGSTRRRGRSCGRRAAGRPRTHASSCTTSSGGDSWGQHIQRSRSRHNQEQIWHQTCPVVVHR
jgi:hypothetical protein